ncbi:hypothetical protein BCU70_11980 [Vibrio sp. 10N.286.49.C2]|uniref:hypothetical protein n=1 Tax=unclassified Vibrio TaxID=2614977 RepID=UPI000C843FC9|nr:MULTISPECIES: hypothetical protein [unclassified Vibrio]PMH40060.1 hypothetical protein BCU70_11980 [Vibrio sp. 10N.286.49.C2]PMH52165.1 hypothetical protein BCU66_16275 [Vibrio sp. 10N.286.49.B1]PMH78999.1 hypothetical protein BCU58_07170 [Vibrio sp. 10N.286.48.B7]
MSTQRIISAGLLIFSHSAFTNPIPSVSNPSGTDRIRTTGGATCEQAVSTGKTFQVGTYGSSGADDQYNDGSGYDPYHNYYNEDDRGVYAAVTIQFGGEDRIDCTKLYQYEMLQRKREEQLAQAEHELKLLQIEAEKHRLLNMKQTNTSFSE